MDETRFMPDVFHLVHLVILADGTGAGGGSYITNDFKYL
jgi:hypothetical protein